VSFVLVLLLVAVFHYVNGGIRLQTPFQRVTPQVKAHLSVILALIGVHEAAQYYLGRFELVFSKRGTVDGATLYDVKAPVAGIELLDDHPRSRRPCCSSSTSAGADGCCP